MWSNRTVLSVYFLIKIQPIPLFYEFKPPAHGDAINLHYFVTHASQIVWCWVRRDLPSSNSSKSSTQTKNFYQPPYPIMFCCWRRNESEYLPSQQRFPRAKAVRRHFKQSEKDLTQWPASPLTAAVNKSSPKLASLNGLFDNRRLQLVKALVQITEKLDLLCGQETRERL